MGYFKLILEAISNGLAYLRGRQDLANSPDMKQAKKAQQEQDTADTIERLTDVALNHPDYSERLKAREQLRKLDSE